MQLAFGPSQGLSIETACGAQRRLRCAAPAATASTLGGSLEHSPLELSKSTGYKPVLAGS
jgi:hypothetical protein